ncbi:hypothetical protein [Rhodopseudomonas palustris]|uniref:Uncharacterized protein n=1 Tax=Rhodopseudomonas palustris (strain BisB18) TaxID=316056 RepID=Q20Y96_RHOPB
MSGFISPIAFTSSSSSPLSNKPLDTKPLLDALKPQTVEEKFLAYANMTPAEKLRDSLLKSIGVTEDDLKTMSPKDREAIEDKIKEKIKEAAENQTEKKTGFITDISV